MSTEELFKSCHGTLDMSKLIRLSDVIENEELLRKYFRLSIDEVKEALEHLSVDASNIYHHPNDILNQVSYIRDFCMVEVHSLSKEFLETLMTKERIEAQENYISNLIKKGDWDTLLSFTDKRISLLKFVEHYKSIPKEQLVDVFQSVYTRQEVGFHLLDEELINYVFSYKELSEERNERMKELLEEVGNVEEVTIYRGSYDDIRDGYSWTTSYDDAHFFANRFDKNGTIFEGIVRMSDILDYYNNRGEHEVLVNPRNVIDI